MLTYGQWQEELLEELRTQAKLAQDVLSIPWASRWAMLLVQWLSWDLLKPSTAQPPTNTSSPVCDWGVPNVAEGETLPGFPGVTIP